MKHLRSGLLVALMLTTVAGATAGPPKMEVSVAGDVLIPIGSWSDAVGVGFGGDAQFQYNFTPVMSGGVTIGYFTWGGKDVGGFDTGGYSGIPFRVFGKYYFMPAKKKGVRVYGSVELGLFFGSTGDIEYTIPSFIPGTPGTTSTISGASSTDFNYVIAVGADMPISKDGRTKLTGNVRWDAIASSSSANNFGFRVGVQFGIGK
ncbi:MAG: hypothetical protein KAJ12_10330 [Bacteroidetes bacterium]|nr:hypothetical protein [Bacteroidota bacterium]